ncbi:MAG: outer membrane beta-barrel protein [Burkholderiales bacterium]|nr:outer membrane beta-barrel protein [Burkholderiales bacterium]
MKTISSLVVAAALAFGAFAAQAQDNVFKFGFTRYDTHAKTNGISGIGVPPGADAKVGDASTVIFVYERLFGPNLGAEIVMGIPPTIKAKASGSVEFLNATGTVLSAKNWAPTLLFNYHFFDPGTTWRPYVGVGVNYTQFRDVKSSLTPDVEMGSSWGPAAQVGVSYLIAKDISAFASVAALKVKSKVVATGATVLTTTVDFRPTVYSLGVEYKF